MPEPRYEQLPPQVLSEIPCGEDRIIILWVPGDSPLWADLLSGRSDRQHDTARVHARMHPGRN